MNSAPQITVVIPTVGRSVFLLEALRSVSGQTVPVAQILLIEDGTNAEEHSQTMEIARRFPAVEVFRLDSRKGVSAARNVGLEHATGDYIVFLDDDDLLHPKMVGNALAVISGNPSIDIAVCLYHVIFTPSGQGDYPEIFPFDFELMDSHPLNQVDISNFAQKAELENTPVSAFLRYLIPTNSCFVKRTAIGETRFPEDLTQGEDTYFWLSLAKNGCKFHMSGQPYALVRRHGHNTTRVKSNYFEEIPKCYRKIRASGMLTQRRDIFLVKLKLFYFTWKQDRLASLRLLLGLLQYPVLLTRETVKFFRVTVGDRRRLLKYYFQD